MIVSSEDIENSTLNERIKESNSKVLENKDNALKQAEMRLNEQYNQLREKISHANL
ncbi:MAG: hypothetical protein WC389_20240 [Lutibacter sp.]|jgi:hypothetical protein